MDERSSETRRVSGFAGKSLDKKKGRRKDLGFHQSDLAVHIVLGKQTKNHSLPLRPVDDDDEVTQGAVDSIPDL